MPKLKSVNIKLEHLQHLSLSETGIVIDNYYDINESTDDSGETVEISYDELKVSLLEDIVIREINVDSKESIKNNTFKAADDKCTQEVLKEIRALKKFAEELEDSLLNSISYKI